MSNIEENHRAMINFLVARLRFYKEELIPLKGEEIPERFHEENSEVLVKIFDQAVNRFNTKPTIDQMNDAVTAYLNQT